MSTDLSKDHLLWIDIETGGLDQETSRILEVEFRLTGMEADVVMSTFHSVISRDDDTGIDSYCLELHKGNGLLDESKESGTSWSDFIAKANEWLLYASIGRILHPAGSSVWNDIEFLNAQAPGLLDKVDHRRLDVTSLYMAYDVNHHKKARNIWHDVGPTDHRTSTCLDNEIKEYRELLTAFDE